MTSTPPEMPALKARFDEGSASALPSPDASGDVVSSLVGAMFAPGQSGWRTGCPGSPGRAGGSCWGTGRRAASSGACSPSWAGMSRRPC